MGLGDGSYSVGTAPLRLLCHGEFESPLNQLLLAVACAQRVEARVMLRTLARGRLLPNLGFGPDSTFADLAKAPRWIKFGVYLYIAQMLVGLIAGFAAPFFL
jgi:hypothetical protein